MTWPTPAVVNTERLRLRVLRREDAGAIAAHMANWNVTRMLSMPPWPYGPSDAEEFLDRTLARAIDDPDCSRAIAERASDTLIGIIGGRLSGAHYTIGYWLGEPYWGRGYMTEAVTSVVGAIFTSDEDAVIKSGAFKDNPASLRVQKNVGFRVVGESQILCRPRGEKVTHVDTELTFDAFQRRRS
ncbi:MAG: GNAT family N-acetyltransferase [Pseudomonadota bacterium]